MVIGETLDAHVLIFADINAAAVGCQSSLYRKRIHGACYDIEETKNRYYSRTEEIQ